MQISQECIMLCTYMTIYCLPTAKLSRGWIAAPASLLPVPASRRGVLPSPYPSPARPPGLQLQARSGCAGGGRRGSGDPAPGWGEGWCFPLRLHLGVAALSSGDQHSPGKQLVRLWYQRRSAGKGESRSSAPPAPFSFPPSLLLPGKPQ